MEIGETISPPQLPSQGLDKECPFEHNPPPEDKTKNELGGIGSVLGTNMAEGVGVGVHSYGDGPKDPDPWKAGVRSVTIKVAGEVVKLRGEPLPYPVTCAAHHLIPAQESLKGHRILNFMCKKGEKQDFLNRKSKAPAAVDGSMVWGNIGYNVNGCQNGGWLPGNYAVGGGRRAVEIWKNRTSDRRTTYSDREAAENWAAALDLSADAWAPKADDEENEGPQGEALVEALLSVGYPDYALAGANFKIDPANPKWAYVKASMDAARGQFHDRHLEYSKEVKKYLDKVANAYELMLKRSKEEKCGCEKCRVAERPSGAPKDSGLVGPPLGLVSRLVQCSEFFRRHLSPETQLLTINIYTSNWVKKWFEPRLSSVKERK